MTNALSCGQQFIPYCACADANANATATTKSHTASKITTELGTLTLEVGATFDFGPGREYCNLRARVALSTSAYQFRLSPDATNYTQKL